ncbi:beta strand repeat-containing protein [Coraliomargarita parva]|uniref:beta strand repeat-containing protein n=1 Tax=Coraliomargarita parva TaxID=3014050 RepID=UPI0022B5A064|nr:hypothetical protein [Coraliomargarita parva]
MKKHPKVTRSLLATSAIVIAFSSTAQAADYVLRASDGSNASSFTTPYTGTPGGWATIVGGTDVGAPSVGNNYTVTTGVLRTPDGDSTDYTFAGDSLTLNGAGANLYLLGVSGATYTINDFILKEGHILNARGVTTLAGSITLDGTVDIENGSAGDLTIDSSISGSGTINFVASTKKIIVSNLNNSSINVDYSSTGGYLSFTNDTTIGSLSSSTSSGRISFDGSDLQRTLTVNQTTDVTVATQMVGGYLVLGSGSTAALTLTGSNNVVRQATTIEGGTLVVGDGSTGVISGAVAVNTGTLSGSLASGNNFSGSVVIGDGSGTADAILTAGTTDDLTGRLAIAGNLNLGSDSELVFDLLTSAGVLDSDLVVVGSGSGTTTITGSASLLFVASGDNSGLTVGQIFTVIDGGTINGYFSNLADGGTISSNGVTMLAAYSGGDLTLEVTAIPEPSAYAMALALAVCGLVIVRRRKAS